ncbi:MAG: hypothetical protein AB7O28_19735 [Vicinamibacterales bacterium]
MTKLALAVTERLSQTPRPGGSPMRRVLAGVALLALSVSVVSAQPGAAPAIHRTALDVEAGVLTITGTGLGADVVVLVDGRPTVVLPGATDTEVKVVAPESVLATAGAFRVVVGDPGRRLGDGFVVLSPGGRTAGGLVGESGVSTAVPDDRGAARSRDAAAPGVARPVAVGPDLIENSANTAVGLGALVSASTGYYNAALGYNALNHNTAGIHNTASGAWSLHWNTTGNYNTATGEDALWSNTTASYNTAAGKAALYANTTGSFNTASGNEALRANTTGFYNTANGHTALYGNTTGHWNTAGGVGALANNSSGANNAAFGFQAGANATTGSFNVFLGSNVYGTTADTNTIRIGLPYSGGVGQNRTFIAGIHGAALSGPAVQVFVDANGQLGTVAAPVVTGGGTTTPAALPRAVQERLTNLEQLVRDQAAALAEQAAALSAMRERLSVLEVQRAGRP